MVRSDMPCCLPASMASAVVKEGEQGKELLRAQGTVGIVGQHTGDGLGQCLEEALARRKRQTVARIIGVGTLLFEQPGSLGRLAKAGEDVSLCHVD